MASQESSSLKCSAVVRRSPTQEGEATLVVILLSSYLLNQKVYWECNQM